LTIAGIATVAGWKPALAIRSPNLTGGGNGPAAMAGYGATYAIASLSCTIGPFLAVTGAALSQSTIEGLATYIAYALGMGIIILAISVASALAHNTVANHMRRLSRVASRLGGVLMILAGGYAIWYGRWELAVYDGDLSSDPVIDTMEDLRLWIIAFVQTVGATRLASIVAATVLAIIALARLTGPGNALGDQAEPPSDAPPPLWTPPS
jgi:cytochrome c-type biogenesis protein